MFKYTIIPDNLAARDPRSLAYRFPDRVRSSDVRFVAWIKRLTRFFNFNTLRIIEDFVKRDSGRYLVPGTIMNWRRREKYQNSRIEVGGSVYFAMHLRELTPAEMKKYEDYVEEARGTRV